MYVILGSHQENIYITSKRIYSPRFGHGFDAGTAIHTIDICGSTKYVACAVDIPFESVIEIVNDFA